MPERWVATEPDHECGMLQIRFANLSGVLVSCTGALSRHPNFHQAKGTCYGLLAMMATICSQDRNSKNHAQSQDDSNSSAGASEQQRPQSKQINILPLAPLMQPHCRIHHRHPSEQLGQKFLSAARMALYCIITYSYLRQMNYPVMNASIIHHVGRIKQLEVQNSMSLRMIPGLKLVD